MLCALAVRLVVPRRNGTFPMYAGYVNVDKTNNRNLYYWFVESQGNAATDPVILWLNGGVYAQFM